MRLDIFVISAIACARSLSANLAAVLIVDTKATVFLLLKKKHPDWRDNAIIKSTVTPSALQLDGR